MEISLENLSVQVDIGVKLVKQRICKQARSKTYFSFEPPQFGLSRRKLKLFLCYGLMGCCLFLSNLLLFLHELANIKSTQHIFLERHPWLVPPSI